jgi:hypothetical protein
LRAHVVEVNTFVREELDMEGGERRGVIELASLLAQEGVLQLPEDADAALIDKLTEGVDAQLGAAAVMSYIGRPAYVGRNASGGWPVRFNDERGNTAYSSAWPEWAYEVANTALVTGKKLWVIANGDPFGSNLITVLILAN